jgi:CRISPR-associated protein Cas2
MYVIIVYDINKDRVNKVKSKLRQYLYWIQNSVFEGEITKSNYKKMIKELKEIINENVDSIIIYEMPPMYTPQKKIIGIEKSPINNIF